jgi:hypothetical protein
MAEQPKTQTQTPKTAKAEKPAQSWGLTDLDCLQAWAGKPVRLLLTSGRELSGALVGYAQFTLTLREPGGAVVMVNKGAVAEVRGA